MPSSPARSLGLHGDDALRALFRHSTDILALLDADLRFRFASPATEALLGVEPSALEGEPVMSVVHPDDVELVAEAFGHIRGAGDTVGPITSRALRADGQVRMVEFTASDVSGVVTLDGAIVINSRDVTSEHRQAEQLAYERTHDPATGLAGETLMSEALQAALDDDPSLPLTLVAASVGDLRLQSGVSSRTAREEALRLLGERMEQTCTAEAGSHPRLVARVDSDTFLLLCRDAGHSDPRTRGERVMASLAAPFEVDGGTVVPLVHVAVVDVAARAAERGAVPAETVVEEAHIGLRTARDHHTDVVVVDEDLVEEHRTTVELVSDLRAAVAAGDLHLAYQPKVALDRDRIVGVEALARWDHPTRGPIAPPVFIGLAETYGLIDELGAWILREALVQAAAWRRELPGPGLGMAVNISPCQFTDDLPTQIAQALAETRVPAHLLTLEVTEGTLMEDTAAASRVITELRDLGVRTSIDDFGTGYSSLSYLRHLPVDELKIDRSFVGGLDTDPGDTAIVTAIIAMAHALDMAVVAEGVEDATQLGALHRLDAEVAQGFLLSHPVSAGIVAQRVRADRLGPVRVGRLGTVPIVVVESDPRAQQLLAMSLSVAGYSPHTVADGTTALAEIRHRRPLAAIVDLDAPGLRGTDLCRLLRADPRTASCALLVVSSHAASGDRMDALRAGADDYLSRPVSPREVAIRTTAAIRGRQATGDEEAVS